MTSQPDEVKAIRQWTFGQLTEYKIHIHYFKNHAENEAGSLIPDFFLFF